MPDTVWSPNLGIWIYRLLLMITFLNKFLNTVFCVRFCYLIFLLYCFSWCVLLFIFGNNCYFVYLFFIFLFKLAYSFTFTTEIIVFIIFHYIYVLLWLVEDYIHLHGSLIPNNNTLCKYTTFLITQKIYTGVSRNLFLVCTVCRFFRHFLHGKNRSIVRVFTISTHIVTATMDFQTTSWAIAISSDVVVGCTFFVYTSIIF